MNLAELFIYISPLVITAAEFLTGFLDRQEVPFIYNIIDYIIKEGVRRYYYNYRDLYVGFID